jgi:hypothetical protein
MMPGDDRIRGEGHETHNRQKHRRNRTPRLLHDAGGAGSRGHVNDGAAFMLVDNVTIGAVPLPAVLWSMGTACAAFAGFVRRGRRKG